MNQPNDGAARPLTPATLHILLSLAREPVHGYHIKRMIEERTYDAVVLGAGTLYAGIRRMTNEGLIEETDPPRDAGNLEPVALALLTPCPWCNWCRWASPLHRVTC